MFFLFFFYYLNLNRTFCKQTVETLIRRRVLRRLVWVCTICLRPTERTLNIYRLIRVNNRADTTPRTQHSDTGEARIRGPSVSSPTTKPLRCQINEEKKYKCDPSRKKVRVGWTTSFREEYVASRKNSTPKRVSKRRLTYYKTDSKAFFMLRFSAARLSNILYDIKWVV